MRLLILLCFLISILGLKAQTVTFNESAAISSLMNDYINSNIEQPTLRGWRIQIISTDNRREMESTKYQFENMYPGMSAAWQHMAPYYQLRVGAYDNKIKMMAFLNQIKKDFPLATPVIDEIDKTDFVR